MSERIYYTTIDGDRLDDIAYRRYGVESGAVEWIIENNPSLRDMGILLPLGIELTLPSMPVAAGIRTVNPWSRAL